MMAPLEVPIDLLVPYATTVKITIVLQQMMVGAMATL